MLTARGAPRATEPFTVRRDRGGGVVVLTMHGTGEGNAMGASVFSVLPDLVGELAADPANRAVLLRGAGDCFTVGLDVRWYLTHYRRMVRQAGGELALRTQLLAEADRMQQAISAISHSRLPFVAAVHGPCIGAGLDLVCACDIRLASAGATFSLREVRIGVVADLGSLQRLPRLIGAGPTRELALTGRDMPAEEAYRRGLVSRVLPDPAALGQAAYQLAEQIAAHPPHVVAGIKDVLEHSQDLSVPAGLRYAGVWNAAFLPFPELPELLAAALRGSPPARSPDQVAAAVPVGPDGSLAPDDHAP
jgi:enoyl-CoA hydratase/carnithine racemase